MKRIFPILSFALCSLLLLLQITSVITVGVLNDMAKVLSCSIEVLPEGGYAMVTDPALWDKFAFDSSVMTFIRSIPDAFHIEMPVTSISNISAALGDALPILYATGAMLALALCLTELLRLILSKKAVGHETA